MAQVASSRFKPTPSCAGEKREQALIASRRAMRALEFDDKYQKDSAEDSESISSGAEEDSETEYAALVKAAHDAQQGGMETLELPFDASTYAGLALAALLTMDVRYRIARGARASAVQMVYMLILHTVTITAQFLLIYWVFVSGLLYSLDPYVEAARYEAAVKETLDHDPPMSLTGNKTDVAVAALARCQKDTTHGGSHMIVLGIWGTRMVMELAEASWRLYCFWNLQHPAKPGRLIDWSKDTPSVRYVTRKIKVMFITFISAPQFLICLLLAWTGAKVLVSALSMSGLVLKALTLQYVIGLDELVYGAFVSVRFKQVAGSMKYSLQTPHASPNWKTWGSNSIKLTFLVGYLLFAAYMFRSLHGLRHECRRYLTQFPNESRAHTAHWLFGGDIPSWVIT
uniref:Uncharacterized protein n=1 Tax=Alexandrium andersonii TaxID=327968 RepID=A0A7S2MKQ5_9DINO